MFRFVFSQGFVARFSFPAAPLSREAAGLHSIQRKTEGKVAGNLLWNGVMENWGNRLDSFIPSALLDQKVHRLGLQERTSPHSTISSPQHLQIRESMALSEPGEFPDHPPPVPAPMVIADGAQRMKKHASKLVVGDHSVHTDYRGIKGERLRDIRQGGRGVVE
jgi:hypothetical protein